MTTLKFEACMTFRELAEGIYKECGDLECGQSRGLTIIPILNTASGIVLQTMLAGLQKDLRVSFSGSSGSTVTISRVRSVICRIPESFLDKQAHSLLGLYLGALLNNGRPSGTYPPVYPVSWRKSAGGTSLVTAEIEYIEKPGSMTNLVR